MNWLLDLIFGLAVRGEQYRQEREARRRAQIAASDAAIREELAAAERRRTMS